MELEGIVQNGVIVPDGECTLPEGSRVRIEPVDCHSGSAAVPRPVGIGKHHSGHSDVSGRTRSIIRQAVMDRQWP